MEKTIFDRDKSAVIIVDMVNDFLKPGGAFVKGLGDKYVDQEELIGSNRRLIEAARSAQVPVFFTRTVRKPGEPRYLEHFIPLTGHRAKSHALESLVEGTWGDEIIDELKPLPTEHIIHKKRRSAFLNTSLDFILRSLGRTTLVITGIGTPGCVESTVRSAFDLDYYIVMPKECTSTSSGAEDKQRALVHIGNHCAIVSTLEKVVSAMKAPTPVPLLNLREMAI